MSNYLNLKETCVSYNLAFVSTDNPAQNILRKMKKLNKLRWNKKTLIVSFCLFFEWPYQIFVTAGDIGHYAMSPWSLEIFLIFPYFLRSFRVYIQLDTQFIYKVSSTKDSLPFWMWWMEFGLKILWKVLYNPPSILVFHEPPPSPPPSP